MGFLKTEAVTHSAALISSKSLPKGGKPMVVIGKPVLVTNHHLTNVTDFIITPCHCKTLLIHVCKDLWNLVPSDIEREYIEKNMRGSSESCAKEHFWIFALQQKTLSVPRGLLKACLFSNSAKDDLREWSYQLWNNWQSQESCFVNDLLSQPMPRSERSTLRERPEMPPPGLVPPAFPIAKVSEWIALPWTSTTSISIPQELVRLAVSWALPVNQELWNNEQDFHWL